MVDAQPTRLAFRGQGGIELIGDRFDPQGDSRAAAAMLLLHGGGQTRHSWRTSARNLTAAGWSVITVDARGHGDSAWAADGDYSLDAFVADLVAILDTLDEPPVVVGASLGGLAAMVALGERPERASALILVDITPRMALSGRDRIEGFMTSAPDGFASLDEAADAIHAFNPRRPRPRDPVGLKRNLRQRASGRWYWHWDPQFLRCAEQVAGPAPTARLYRAIPNITVPTMLVRGTESDVVTTEAVTELLDLIPHATCIEVSASHMAVGDDNDAFAGAVTDFLSAMPR